LPDDGTDPVSLRTRDGTRSGASDTTARTRDRHHGRPVFFDATPTLPPDGPVSLALERPNRGRGSSFPQEGDADRFRYY
jgi:hypothetical protein